MVISPLPMINSEVLQFLALLACLVALGRVFLQIPKGALRKLTLFSREGWKSYPLSCTVETVGILAIIADPLAMMFFKLRLFAENTTHLNITLGVTILVLQFQRYSITQTSNSK